VVKISLINLVLLLFFYTSSFASNDNVVDIKFKDELLTFISKVDLNKAFIIVDKEAKDLKEDAVLGRIILYGKGFKGKGNSIEFQYSSNQVPFVYRLLGNIIADISIEINLDDYKIISKELYYSSKTSFGPLKKQVVALSNEIDIINKAFSDSGLSTFINKYKNKDIDYMIEINNFRNSIGWDINIYTDYYNVDSKSHYYLVIDDNTGEILTRWCTDSEIRDIVGMESRQY
jgi:hypothetical protein